MRAQNMIEPALPNEAEQLPLMEAAADLRTAAVRLLPGIGASSRAALADPLIACGRDSPTTGRCASICGHSDHLGQQSDPPICKRLEVIQA